MSLQSLLLNSHSTQAKRVWKIGLLCGLCAIQPVFSFAARAERPPIRLEIVLMRHGVRSPTSAPEDLGVYSNQSWPNWSIDVGQLTPHGVDVMQAIGARYLEDYRKRGVIHTRCEQEKMVTIADSVPRNQASAEAFLTGMQPNCLATFSVAAHAVANPLFHFPVAKSSDKKTEDLVPQNMYPALAKLQEVLLGCDGPICWNAALQHNHTLLWNGAPEANALKNAGSLSENIMLEYAEGFPLSQVGWGRVSQADIEQLITLHNASFAATKQNMPTAAQLGSNLLAHMLATLQDAAGQTADTAPLAPFGTRVVLLMGHDSNLANIAGLLNTTWKTPNQSDLFPPGGALLFDLIKKDHQYYVTVRVRMPELDALRQADFKKYSSLRTTTLRLDACNGQRSCPLSEFASWINGRLSQAYIQQNLPNMVETLQPILSVSQKNAGE